MKKILSLIVVFVLVLSLASCKRPGEDKKIMVGATSSPHAEILKSDAVQNYLKSKGYTLEVIVYNNWRLLNKSLNDYALDANYFQHTPYLNEDISAKGFKLSPACEVHNEPLNLYGKTSKTDFSNTIIYIVNDPTNVERAFALLKAQGLIDSYNANDFNPQNPIYSSRINVEIKCLDATLLTRHVDEGSYAVIPGNYALTAWGTSKATNYKIFGESVEVAYPNIVAVRTEDLGSEKTKVLVEALSQPEVKAYIEEKYGPTVNYTFKNLLE